MSTQNTAPERLTAGPLPVERVPEPLVYFPRSAERWVQLGALAHIIWRKMRRHGPPLLLSVIVHLQVLWFLGTGVRAGGRGWAAWRAGASVAGLDPDPRPRDRAITDLLPPPDLDPSSAEPWFASTASPVRELCPGSRAEPGDSGPERIDPAHMPDIASVSWDEPAQMIHMPRPAMGWGHSAGAWREPWCPLRSAMNDPEPDRGYVSPFDPKPVGFLGVSARGARQVTFVCEVSGSMISKMATLQQALRAAVDELKPIHSFNVIWMEGCGGEAFDRDGLVPGIAANKRKAEAFIGGWWTGGDADPRKSLDLAFSQQPDVIYLLTDADFPDNAAVLATVRQANANRRVRVHTIAFVNEHDVDRSFHDLLRTIARENGGLYTLVREEVLRARLK